MVNVTRLNRVVKKPEQTTDPYKLIDIFVGDKQISARPYEFETHNDILYPTRFITMCPGCGSTLEFGATHDTDLSNIVLACESCKLGIAEDEKQKLIPPFVDPIGKLFREERFVIVDQPVVRAKNTDQINVKDENDIIFSAQAEQNDTLDITMRANERIEPDVIEECDAD